MKNDILNIVLIFAGGVGTRVGNEVPKQFLKIDNKSILIHTILNFEKLDDIDEIVLVCKSEWINQAKSMIEEEKITKVSSVIPGGETALDSQYLGLKHIKKLHTNEKIIVLIHDGVRPLVNEKTIKDNIYTVKTKGSAITTTKSIETVLLSTDHNNVDSVLDRKICYTAKAPQSFFLDDILYAHEESIKDNNRNFIDSASLMISYGYKLNLVNGEYENIKITTPIDFYTFSGIYYGKKEKLQ